MSNQSTTRFLLKNVRIAFPKLFKAEQYEGQGSFRCGAALILPPNHPQIKQIEKVIEDAAAAKWKDKATTRLAGARKKQKVALFDGDDKAKYDGFPGNQYISANCRGGETEEDAEKPTVFTADKVKVTKAHESPIYAGCYVNALVEWYADDRYGDGVFCRLVGVQFFKDGDAFGSAPASEDDFEDVSDGATADDLA